MKLESNGYRLTIHKLFVYDDTICCINRISLSLSLTLRQTQHTAGSESTGGATTAAASVKMISSGRISRAATKQRPFYTQGGIYSQLTRNGQYPPLLLSLL